MNDPQYNDLLARVAQLESQVAYIAQHLGLGGAQGPPPTPPLGGSYSYSPKAEQPWVQLARSGRKIEAIKAYREATGVGLAEAKNAIDDLGY